MKNKLNIVIKNAKRPYSFDVEKVSVIASIAKQSFIAAIFLCLALCQSASASYLPFNTNVHMNVGIGSANPGQSLDVQGSVRATSFIGNGAQLTGVNSSQWTTTNTTDVYLPNSGNVGIGTTITTAGSALSVMNGNVGIGTWVPANKMDVVRGAVGSMYKGAYETSSFEFNGDNKFGIYTSSASASDGASLVFGQTNLQASSTYPGFEMQYEYSSTLASNRLRFNSLQRNSAGSVTGAVADILDLSQSGNVGIGSPSPESTLDIEGANSGGLGADLVLANKVTATNTAVAIDFGVDNSTTANGAGNAQIKVINVGGGGGQGSDMTFSTWNGSAFGERMRIQYGGNIGIGSVSPGTLLDIVNPSSNGYLRRTIGTSGAVVGDYIDNAGRATIIANGEETGGNPSTGGGYFSAVGYQETWYGLSTLSAPSGQQNMRFGEGQPSNIFQIQHLNDNGSGILSTPFSVENDTPTYSMYLNSSGYTGFGTNAPDARISIHGSNIWDSGISIDNAGTGGIEWSLLSSNNTFSQGAGRLLFYRNASDGSGATMTLDQNGNVGIGTWVPVQVLDVKGTIRTTNFTMTGQTPVSGYVLTASDSNGDTTWTSAGGVSGWTITNTTDVYETSNGNVGIGTTKTTTAALTVMNGNVGIGTWIPGAKLAVKGGAAVFDAVSSPGTVDITGSSDGAQYSNFFLADDADAHEWSFSYRTQAGDAHSFMIWNYNGSSFTNVADFAENGNIYLGGSYNESNSTGTYLNVIGSNVGIGLIAPEAPLHVYGTLKVGGAANQQTGVIALGDDLSTGTYNGLYRGGVGTLGSNNYLNIGGYQGVNITTGNASFGSQGVRMVVDVNGNIGIGTTTTVAGLSIMNGNVGIGTWVPSSPLHVVSTGTANIATFTGSGGTANISYQGNWQGGVGNGGYDFLNASFDQIVAKAVTYPALEIKGYPYGGTQTGDLLQFFSSSGALLSDVTANGNIGIGTFVPLSKLNVNGGVGIGTTLTNGNYLNINAAPSGGLIVQGNVGIGTWLPGEALDVEGGNVGIGSVAPNGNLDVGGGTICLGHSCQSSWPAGGSSNWIYSSSGNVGLSTTSAVGIGTTFVGGTGEGALTVMNGNVGISTWLPTQNLTVAGSIDIFGANSTDAVFSSAANNLTVSGVHIISGYGMWVRGTRSSGMDATAGGGNLGIYAGGTQYVTVTTGGNVGIGTAMSGATGSLIVNSGNVGIGTVTPAGGLVVMSGNVGIGTWIPTLPFSVTGDTYHNGNIGIGTTFVGATSEGALSVMNGNVGIGTWIPSAQLQINLPDSGAMILQNTSGNAFVSQGIEFRGASGSTEHQARIMGYTINGAGGNLLFQVASSGGASYLNRMSIDNNGNVGIGTWPSQTKLAVMGNIGVGTFITSNQLSINGSVGIGTSLTNTNYISSNTAPSGGMIIQGNVGVGTYIPSQSFEIGNQKLDITSNGNLGIGTIAPTGALEIEGGNVGIGTWTVPDGGSSNTVHWGNVGIGTAKIGGAGEGALTVMNGNVGIGTWVPAYPLDLVNSTVRARYIRRVNTITSSATPAINTDTTDLFTITALATTITSMTSGLTGTPNNGDLLEVRILDAGSAEGITWGTSFASTTVTLPTTTVSSTTLRILLEWNSASSKWECIGVA
jgi:hypothetical protein